MKIETKVHPNGSYSNYLAYGTMDDAGNFKRVGYPKDVLKPEYGSSWGVRGKASYEYTVAFEVPSNFKWHIVKIYNGKQGNGKIEVLYAPTKPDDKLEQMKKDLLEQGFRGTDEQIKAAAEEAIKNGQSAHEWFIAEFDMKSIDYSADSGDFDTASRITPDPTGDDVAADDGRPVDVLRTAWHYKMTMMRLYGRFSAQCIRAVAIFDALFAVRNVKFA